MAAASAPAPEVIAALQRALLEWYAEARRDLPWRDMDDPYAIWVSEIMLQQTRVETVVPYYLRWMERLPTVTALAEADPETVMRLWSGLGYYSRARNLQRAARVVRDGPEGAFPRDRDGLARLPGIGPYTSGAIASIAFGERVPAVDGNVQRVLARLFRRPEDITTPKGRRAFEGLAAGLVPADRPGDWNEALMELGATVCTPRAPLCGTCPVADPCQARRTDTADRFPVRTPKRPPRVAPMHFAWIERAGRLLLVRGATGGLLDGLWGLPGGLAERPLEEWVQEQTGLQVAPGAALGTADHRFTHRVWRMSIHAATPLPGGSTAVVQVDTRWVAVERMHAEAVSTAQRKAIAAGLAARRPWGKDTGTSSTPLGTERPLPPAH